MFNIQFFNFPNFRDMKKDTFIFQNMDYNNSVFFRKKHVSNFVSLKFKNLTTILDDVITHYVVDITKKMSQIQYYYQMITFNFEKKIGFRIFNLSYHRDSP